MLICLNCGVENNTVPCRECKSTNVKDIFCPYCEGDNGLVALIKPRVWCPVCDEHFPIEEE